MKSCTTGTLGIPEVQMKHSTIGILGIPGFQRLDSPGGRFLLEGLDVCELHGLAPTPGLEHVSLEWEKGKEKRDWDRNNTRIHPRVPAQRDTDTNKLLPFHCQWIAVFFHREMHKPWDPKNHGMHKPWDPKNCGMHKPWDPKNHGIHGPWDPQIMGSHKSWNSTNHGIHGQWNSQITGSHKPWNSQTVGSINHGTNCENSKFQQFQWNIPNIPKVTLMSWLWISTLSPALSATPRNSQGNFN